MHHFRTVYALIIVLGFLAIEPHATSAQEAASVYIHGDLTPGSYEVGFKVYHEYDYSRTFKPEFDDAGQILASHKPRPMQIAVWYPAVKGGSAEYMKLREYYYLDATVEDPTVEVDEAVRLNMDQAFQYQNLFTGPADPDRLHGFLDVETRSLRDATAADGSFPLVIYSPREYRGVYYNTQMIEYLVSRGFVVAATPNKDMSSASTQSQTSVDILLTNMGDLQFVKGFMSRYPNVDVNRVGIVGYAWGAMPAIALAEADPNVSAVVSLDGNIRFPGSRAILDAVPAYSTASLTKPMLHLETSNPNQQNAPIDYAFYDAIKYADAHHVKFRDAQWFTPSTFFYLVHGKGTSNQAQFDYEALDLAASGMILYTERFLAAYLQSDRAARSWLNNDPVANGFEAGALTVQAKTGVQAPPTEAIFTNLFLERGSEVARRVWDRVAHDLPDYQLATANGLNGIGYTLIGQGDTEEAIEAFKMQVEAYPSVANAWDSMGEGYMANGDDDLAIDAFQKSLTMNPPQNTKDNSISLLGQLGVEYVEPEPRVLSQAEATWIEGTYEITVNNQKQITRIEWADGGLVATTDGQTPIRMVPKSENVFWTFVAGNALGITFEFVRGGDGPAEAARVTDQLASSTIAPRVDDATSGTR